jgi:Domain of unknown function (DUF4234)
VTSGEATLAPPTWSWPASAPPDPTKEGLVSDADADERVTGGSSGPPSGEPLEADPTEVTIVAAITTPEKALPKVTSFGPAGKRRSTPGIVVLSIVTLGVYSLVWHHRINREVGNFDTRMHVVPGRSTVAVAIPWAIGWLVSVAGAVRIVLAVANVTLPFDPHFTVLQAYGLLAGGLLIPYLELLLAFSAIAIVMTLERVRIVEDRMGRTTDVQLRPARAILWMLLPIAGGLILMATMQRRLNRAWEDDMAAAPAVRPTVRAAPS